MTSCLQAIGLMGVNMERDSKPKPIFIVDYAFCEIREVLKEKGLLCPFTKYCQQDAKGHFKECNL